MIVGVYIVGEGDREAEIELSYSSPGAGIVSDGYWLDNDERLTRDDCDFIYECYQDILEEERQEYIAEYWSHRFSDLGPDGER